MKISTIATLLFPSVFGVERTESAFLNPEESLTQITNKSILQQHSKIMAYKRPEVVVVGAGLAGLTAAIKAVDEGAFVTLVDKAGYGGNSAKATSGANAAESVFQKRDHIEDSCQSFIDDIIKSGGGIGDPALARVLSFRSAASIPWLDQEFDLELSQVNYMGGHSHARTHKFNANKGNVAPVGAIVTSTLKKRILQYIDEGKMRTVIGRVVDMEIAPVESVRGGPESFPILTKKDGSKIAESYFAEYEPATPSAEPIACDSGFESQAPVVNQFIKSVTIEISEPAEGEDATVQLSGDSVILATGGFGADTSANSLLVKYRPDLEGFPTTNGWWSTGDLQNLCEEKGMKLVDMDKVQLHPSGFVCMDDPFAPSKFLCPEVMRGLGAILFNVKGERFVNELLTRDLVSDACLENGSTATEWLGLEGEASKAETGHKSAMLVYTDAIRTTFGTPAFDFYTKKGMIRKTTISELPQVIKAFGSNPEAYQAFVDGIKRYNAAMDKGVDESTGKTVFKARFPEDDSEPLYVSLVTPSAHFTMGGVKIDVNARVINNSEKPIINLFAVGEVSGGVHGKNRLGGNGCTESMVFGSIAGRIGSHFNGQDAAVEVDRVALKNASPTSEAPVVVEVMDYFINEDDEYIADVSIVSSPTVVIPNLVGESVSVFNGVTTHVGTVDSVEPGLMRVFFSSDVKLRIGNDAVLVI